MNEKETTRAILEYFEEHCTSRIIELEVTLVKDGGHYGIADIVVPEKNIAIEVKGSHTKSARQQKGLGQAVHYSAAGYKSVLALPDDSIRLSIYNAVQTTECGLMGVTEGGEIIVYLEPKFRGGWDLPGQVHRKPKPRGRQWRRCVENELMVGMGKTGWRDKL